MSEPRRSSSRQVRSTTGLELQQLLTGECPKDSESFRRKLLPGHPSLSSVFPPPNAFAKASPSHGATSASASPPVANGVLFPAPGDITHEWLQRNGIERPMQFEAGSARALGMRLPPATLSVDAIVASLGPERVVEALAVSKQVGRKMTLRSWAQYWAQGEGARADVLNLISLEIGESELGAAVCSPAFVRRIDWIDTVWPLSLRCAGSKRPAAPMAPSRDAMRARRGECMYPLAVAQQGFRGYRLVNAKVVAAAAAAATPAAARCGNDAMQLDPASAMAPTAAAVAAAAAAAAPVGGGGLSASRQRIAVRTTRGKGGKTKTCQFRGVTRVRSVAARWQAQITCDGRNHYLGSFHTAELAARAYDRAAIGYWGQRALTNLDPVEYDDDETEGEYLEGRVVRNTNTRGLSSGGGGGGGAAAAAAAAGKRHKAAATHHQKRTAASTAKHAGKGKESRTYPRVQKYCLMSVAGSYTDFHVDFGGTSVWYHLLRGRKVFFLAPPTPRNLAKFQEWSSSQLQGAVFLPDTLGRESVLRMELTAGATLIIPSGWIHAVYTPEDSVVFGGNFLHVFSIGTQLRVWKLEQALGVADSSRFPFFREVHWFAATRFAARLQRQARALRRRRALEQLRNDSSSSSGGGSRRRALRINGGIAGDALANAAAAAGSAELAIEREAEQDRDDRELRDGVWKWPVFVGKHSSCAMVPPLPHACADAELGPLECEQLLLLADGLDGWLRAAGVRGGSADRTSPPSSWQQPSTGGPGSGEQVALKVLSRQAMFTAGVVPNIYDGGALLNVLRSLARNALQHTTKQQQQQQQQQQQRNPEQGGGLGLGLPRRVGGVRPNHLCGVAVVDPDAPDAAKARDMAPCEEAQLSATREAQIWAHVQRITPWVPPQGGSPAQAAACGASASDPAGDARQRHMFEWVLPLWTGEHNAECMAGDACRLKHSHHLAAHAQLRGCLFCNASAHEACLAAQQGAACSARPSSGSSVPSNSTFVCACCEVEDEKVYLQLRASAERALQNGSDVAAEDAGGSGVLGAGRSSEMFADELAELAGISRAHTKDAWDTSGEHDEASAASAAVASAAEGAPTLEEGHGLPLLYHDVRGAWEYQGTKKRRALNKLKRWKALLPRPQIPSPPALVAAGMAPEPFTFCAEVWFDAWAHNMSAHESGWPITHVKLQVVEIVGEQHEIVGALQVAVTDPVMDRYSNDRAMQSALMCVPSLLTKPPSSQFYVSAVTCNIAGHSEPTQLWMERSQRQFSQYNHKPQRSGQLRAQPVQQQQPSVDAPSLNQSMQQQLQREIQNMLQSAQPMQHGAQEQQVMHMQKAVEQQMEQVQQQQLLRQMQQALEQQIQQQQLLQGLGATPEQVQALQGIGAGALQDMLGSLAAQQPAGLSGLAPTALPQPTTPQLDDVADRGKSSKRPASSAAPAKAKKQKKLAAKATMHTQTAAQPRKRSAV